jgi:hypothetical protein
MVAAAFMVGAHVVGELARESLLGNTTRQLDYFRNFQTVKNAHISWPLDTAEVVEQAVFGFMAAPATTHNLAMHGYTSSSYDDVFFAHTNSVIGANADAMLTLEIKHNPAWVGHIKEPMDQTVFHRQRDLNIDEALTCYNRNQIDEAYLNHCLHKEGVRDPGVFDLLVSLRNEIPPVADLIRFAVRDAFYPDIVAAYGEADEYPRILDKYISWQGLGWDTGYTAPASTDADGNAIASHPASWGEIAWFAHWEFPSATQGYDMLHMLYADSPYGPSPYVADGQGGIDKSKTFDTTDLNRLLRASGYSTYWRNKVTAIADPPLSRIDVRKLHLAGVIKDADVYHNYRAQGYNDKNAQWLTQLTIVKEQPDVSKQVCILYQLGIMDEDQSMQVLQKNGHNQVDSQAIMYQCKLEQKIKEVSLVVERIHKSLLSGAIDDNEARGLLAQVGINQDQITVFSNLWGAEKSFDLKIVTRSELLGWYVDGIITDDDLIGRLQRLGYTDRDIGYYKRAADDKIQTIDIKRQNALQAEINREQAKQAATIAKQQAAASKAAKSAQQQAKQQQAQQTKAQKAGATDAKATARAAKDAIAASLKGITVGRLRSWYVAKEITSESLQAYLALMGWLPTTISDYITELDREIAAGIVIEGPGKTPTVAEE